VSFAQEIKDFLGASQSVMKTLGDSEYKRQLSKYTETQNAKMQADMNDPLKDERQKAEIDAIRARAANSRASTGLVAKRGALYDAQLKQLTAPPPEDPVAASIPTGKGRPALQPAIPAEPVQEFADGGLVDEDDDPTDEDDMPAPAIDTPARAPTDVSAQSRTRISPDAGYDAVNAGLKYGVQALGQTGVPTTQRRQRLQAITRGAGAAPLADMQQIFKKIDPNGEMGDSERNIAALSAVYQYKLRAGDPQGAQRAAFTMLQHYRLASQRYAAIAAAAAEHGDVDGAAKAAMKAYANIPDGKDLKITKAPDGRLQYSMIDEKTGKTIQQGIATPQQLAAAAMGVATKGFDQFLLAAAGERAAASREGTSQGNRAPSQRDLKEIKSGIDMHAEEFFDGLKKEGKPATAAEATALKNSAFHIAQENPRLAANEAFEAARTFITAPEPKKGESGAFKIVRDEDTGKNRIMFGDTGREITLSDAELRPLIVLRGKAMKERAEATEKGKGEKSYTDMAIDAGKAVGKMVSDDLDKAEPTLRRAIGDETVERGKSAIRTVGRAIGDAYDWVKEDLSKPPIWDSRGKQ
jgi:hypothetical protein